MSWWLFVPRRGEQTCCLLLGTSVLLGASLRGQWLRAAVRVSLNRRNLRTRDGCKLERKFHENRASRKDKTSKSYFLLSENFTFFSAPKNKANKFRGFRLFEFCYGFCVRVNASAYVHAWNLSLLLFSQGKAK